MKDERRIVGNWATEGLTEEMKKPAEEKKTKLKGCPFKDEALHPSNNMLDVVQQENSWYVSCTACDARGPKEISKEEAIRVWNYRT